MAAKHPKTIRSIRSLARLVGRGESSVRKWTKDTRWPFARKAPWSAELLPKIKWWADTYLSHDNARDYREKIIGDAGGGERPMSKYEQARLALVVERAMFMKQRRLVEAGKLHDVQVCQKRRLRQIHEVKSRLLEIPRVLAASLVGLQADAIEMKIQEQVLAAMEDLSRENETPGTSRENDHG
jgi:FlaA1/EpsC-like NDP-sugar epimerase